MEAFKVTILSAIILGAIALIYKLLEKYFSRLIEEKLMKPKVNENFLKEKVIENPFFREMSSYVITIKHEFDNSIESTNKNKALYNIMINKYIIYRTFFEMLSKELDEFFNDCSPTDNKKCCRLSNNSLYNLVIKYFNNATFIFNKYYLLTDIYTDDEKFILQYVIGKFMIWHKDRIDNFSEYIRQKCYSDDVCSKKKVNDILNTLNDAFAETLEDAKKTLSTLNGELKNKEFVNTNLFISPEGLSVKIFEFNKAIQEKVDLLLKTKKSDDSTMQEFFKESLFEIADFNSFEINKKDSQDTELF